jgi:hypothetical protein
VRYSISCDPEEITPIPLLFLRDRLITRDCRPENPALRGYGVWQNEGVGKKVGSIPNIPDTSFCNALDLERYEIFQPKPEQVCDRNTILAKSRRR